MDDTTQNMFLNHTAKRDKDRQRSDLRHALSAIPASEREAEVATCLEELAKREARTAKIRAIEKLSDEELFKIVT